MNITPAILKCFGRPYIVGGALRDTVLKRPFGDLDLTAEYSGDFGKRVSELAKATGSNLFLMDAENSVWRLTGKKQHKFQIDIKPFQGGTIEEDLLNRDFTINALGMPVTAGTGIYFRPEKGSFEISAGETEIIDPSGGLKDLRAGIIRPVSKKAFTDDPLRMLRLYRLAAKLNFRISLSAAAQVKRHCALIAKSAGERVRDEIMQTLGCPDSKKWLLRMRKSGILFSVFPELAEQEKCAVEYYGKGGVFKHTLATVERTEELFSDLDSYIPRYAEIGGLAPLGRPELFKFAALLHDVAKPAKATEVDGRLRFFGHEECGAIMSEKIMNRLRFSKDDINMVCGSIGEHLRPGNLAANSKITERALFRFYKAVGKNTVPLLLLSWADQSSYIPLALLRKSKKELQKSPGKIDLGKLSYNSYKKTFHFMQVLYLLLNTYLKKDPKNIRPLLTGNDIMEKLDITPSPKVGKILDKLKMLQFEGKIKTRTEALEILRTL